MAERYYTKYLVLNGDHKKAMSRLRVPSDVHVPIHLKTLLMGFCLGIVLARCGNVAMKQLL